MMLYFRIQYFKNIFARSLPNLTPYTITEPVAGNKREKLNSVQKQKLFYAYYRPYILYYLPIKNVYFFQMCGKCFVQLYQSGKKY